MKKIMLIFVLLLMSLTGCWDRAELEEVGFVIGLAFDPNHDNPKTFDTTFHVAIPSAFSGGAAEGDSGGNSPFFNITSTGVTNFNMIRDINKRRSRSLNFEHLKVIVINEELARQAFITGVLDLYTRDHEMRRKTHVLVSKGDAKEVYMDKLPLEDMPAISIEMIEDNSPQVLEMIETRDIGTISEKMNANQSYLISGINKEQREDMKISGAALMRSKDNKMITWLSEEDVKGYNWVMGKAENGIVEATAEEGESFVFEVTSHDTKVHYIREDDENLFNVIIKTEGTFSESWIPGLEIDNAETIKKMEQIISEKIENQATTLINKMQEEWFCDVFYFGSLIKRKEYQYWKQIREDWEGEAGLFKEANVEVDVEVKISHYMTQEKTS
ncbi:Ger(x)C family spore germination protein [Alkalihalophilus lindianensis]|uniref:Ger(X)C family spore germination protein n=1 Tax=Alkalihalophilus lindianensis TaxID=1630542 RepID=A0ABU3XDS6_9BACI|nr:Ger(x)C family spore germination protein [Alkalihalophilus lindianensis]MDV2686041.1 Ger(x)C family spore germination protein [Alkalihalophilus lindianensis]